MEDVLVVVLPIIGMIIYCDIMGFVTKTISKNKGYDGGFWWGFLLGIFGIIIVACKPVNPNPTNHDSSYSSALGLYAQEEENKRILASGGWKCANCNTVNFDYMTTGKCGVSKSNNVPIERPKSKSVLETEEKETSLADEILKLKQLLDAGVLTQDEFDTKKKQLLGL